jgi:hypothetical protein
MLVLIYLLVNLFGSQASLLLVFQSSLSHAAEKAHQEKIQAAREYKASLERLLVLQEANVKSKEQLVQKRRELLTQKIINQSDFEADIKELELARAKVSETKRQILEAEQAAGEIPTANKEQMHSIRTPAPANAEMVLLDVSDRKYIQDALSEMFGAAIATQLGQEKLNEIASNTNAIFKKYCRCTEAEYLDWRAGEGLPSIVHRMNEATLSKADQQQLANYNVQRSSVNAYIKKYSDLVESTARLVEKRMASRFEERKPEGAELDQYKIDFDTLRFVKLSAGEKPVSIYESLTAYFGKYIQKKTEAIKDRTNKGRRDSQPRPIQRRNKNN